MFLVKVQYRISKRNDCERRVTTCHLSPLNTIPSPISSHLSSSFFIIIFIYPSASLSFPPPLLPLCLSVCLPPSLCLPLSLFLPLSISLLHTLPAPTLPHLLVEFHEFLSVVGYAVQFFKTEAFRGHPLLQKCYPPFSILWYGEVHKRSL